MTDRTLKKEDLTSSNTTKQRKTKGISYTRNAQELKKLLMESGIHSSLATATAGMQTYQQDTNMTSGG